MLLLTSLVACGADTDTASVDPVSAATDSDTSGAPSTDLPECPPADTAGEGRIDATCCDTAPTLALWGGTAELEDLAPGGELAIAYSPQYGWELYLYPKVCGTRDIVSLHTLLTDLETGHVLQDATEDAALAQDGPDSCCSDGWLWYSRLDVRGLPDHAGRTWVEAVCGRTVQVTLTATDWDGREASETLDLTFTADEEALGHPCGDQEAT